MSRLAPTLLATVALVTGLAACGGPSAAQQRQDTYIAAIDEARATLTAELQRIDDRAQPTATPASDARTLAAYESAVAKVRLGLRNVAVPEVATAEHRALLAALRSYEVALSRARAAGTRTASAKVAAQREQLDAAATRASANVDAAVAAIRARLAGS